MNALKGLILKMIAGSCISLHPNSVQPLVGYDDGVMRYRSNALDLRNRAKQENDEADRLEKCEQLGIELEGLLR